MYRDRSLKVVAIKERESLPLRPNLDIIGNAEFTAMRVGSFLAYPSLAASILVMVERQKIGLVIGCIVIGIAIIMYAYTTARLNVLQKQYAARDLNSAVLREIETYGKPASVTNVYKSGFDDGRGGAPPLWFLKRVEYLTGEGYAVLNEHRGVSLTEEGARHLREVSASKANEISKIR